MISAEQSFHQLSEAGKGPFLKNVLCRNHLILIITLLGAPPPPRGIPGCDSAVLPVHNRADIFHAGNSETSHCTSAPEGGQGWRKGVFITMKRGFPMKIESLLDLMMGVETSILPSAMDAAAPKGAPRRPRLPDFLETVLAPPCPARGTEAGSAHINCKYFTDFHGSGVNSKSSCPFLQSKKMNISRTASVISENQGIPAKFSAHTSIRQ
jgi:hypothetical protein